MRTDPSAIVPRPGVWNECGPVDADAGRFAGEAVSDQTIPGFVGAADLIRQAEATDKWLKTEAKRSRRSRNGWRAVQPNGVVAAHDEPHGPELRGSQYQAAAGLAVDQSGWRDGRSRHDG